MDFEDKNVKKMIAEAKEDPRVQEIMNDIESIAKELDRDIFLSIENFFKKAHNLNLPSPVVVHTLCQALIETHKKSLRFSVGELYTEVAALKLENSDLKIKLNQ